MKFFTKAQEEKLLANGRASKRAVEKGEVYPDHCPVVKLFTPDARGTWLLSEIDPDCPDVAYGLCDPGLGIPEVGTVSLSELRAVRGTYGLPVERDLWFEATSPLSVYANEAHQVGRIAV